MDSSAELAKIVGPLVVAEDGTTIVTGQASLYLARDLTGREVVLKRTTARSKEQLDSAQSEVALLRKIRHPNVVTFCGFWAKQLQPHGSEINLLMDLCPGGHLLDLQRRREAAGRPITEQEMVRLFVQACRGVECLHRFDPPVAHRDVKLENLLLGGDDGRTVKLCDFGSATTRRTLVTTKEERVRLEDEILRLTTPSYRAPELVDLYSKRLVSEQVDVWALGCVLFALAFGKHAFGEDASPLAILSAKVVLPADPYYSDEFKLLIFWLLEGDPNIRPRIGDVVDELDNLLGNRVRVPAEKRGSGTGARSIEKVAMLSEKTRIQSGAKVKKGSTKAQPNMGVVRGGGFLDTTGVAQSAGRNNGARSGAMESRRNHARAAPLQAAPPAARFEAAPKVESSNNQTVTQSNNPFDMYLPPEIPSANPTFFSTPGMRSTSVAGFPEDFSILSPPFSPASTTDPQGHGPRSSSALDQMFPLRSQGQLLHSSSSVTFGAQPASHAPIFFSDPPPQWRAKMGFE